jgi:hypothetical protein
MPDVSSVYSRKFEVEHHCLACLLNQLLVTFDHAKIGANLAPLMRKGSSIRINSCSRS